MPYKAILVAFLACASPSWEQQTPAFHAASTSSVNVIKSPDGSQTVDILNTNYEVTGTQVPGRPAEERLLLRTTSRSKQVVGDIGMEGSVTLDAWRFGDDPGNKPLYTVTVAGAESHIMDNALWIVSRGLEETDWWSVYKLGSGAHLFDTYVPLVSFSISRETLTTRYVGLEIPPDDTKDPKLKQPNVVGRLTYASEDRVIRQATITCDDAKRAQLLRSYADTTRTIAWSDGTLTISFSQNYPSPANPVAIRIAVHADDLDLAHAQLPAHLHLTR